jgi:Na+-transporting methylmalonyl-CoA/oxaloacetate decarboxylase beta subunit
MKAAEETPRGTEMANTKLYFIGEIAQIAGVAAVVAGVVLSLHHWPAAVALIGGAAAFYVGKKLRTQ